MKKSLIESIQNNINEDVATELNDYNKDIQTILNGLEEIRNKLTTEEGNKILDDYIYSSVSNAINDLDLEVDNDLIG